MSANYPQTAIEFRDQFATEEACRKYLIQLRWPQGISCPRCKQPVWNMKSTFWRCVHCGYDFSLTSGTLFADTHKPLRVWFEAFWYVTNQKSGVSALGLQRVLGLGSYHTAWNWLHKLRRAMVRPGRDRLSGLVEVDEIFIGGPRSGKRGRGAAGKSLVLIASQINGSRIGRIRLVRIPNASAASLEAALKQSVELGAEIHTDGWKGYARLDSIGYNHRVVRETAELGNNLLPRANLVASLLKRWLLGTHQGAVQAKHLDYYLDEYTFRFNRRTARSRGLLFYRLMEQAVTLNPVRGKNIIGGNSSRSGTAISGG